MSPYEITSAGGSVEHYNDESGASWLMRIKEKFPYTVWLNPTHERYWDGVYSLNMIKEFFDDRMYPLTIHGLTDAMKALRGKKLRRSA